MLHRSGRIDSSVSASDENTEGRQHLALSQILPGLPEENRKLLGGKLSVWNSLSQETHSDIFHQDLQKLAVNSESQGTLALAGRIFSYLSQAEEVPTSIAQASTRKLEAMAGRGPLGPRLEHWTQGILQEGMSPVVFGGMVAGGLFYRAGRLSAGYGLLGKSLSQPVFRLGASGAGILAESGGFVLGYKGVATYMGHPQAWDLPTLSEEYGSALTLFTGLRLAGAGMTQVHRGVLGLKTAPSFLKRLPASTYTQTGMYLGIAGTQFYENGRHGNPALSADEVLANSLRLWATFNIAGIFVRSLGGRSLSQLEKGLDSQIAKLEQGGRLPSFPKNWDLALPNLGRSPLALQGAYGEFPMTHVFAMGDGAFAPKVKPYSRPSIPKVVEVSPEPKSGTRPKDLGDFKGVVRLDGRPIPVKTTPQIVQFINNPKTPFRQWLGGENVSFKLPRRSDLQFNLIYNALNQLPYFNDILTSREITLLFQDGSDPLVFTKHPGAFTLEKGGPAPPPPSLGTLNPSPPKSRGEMSSLRRATREMAAVAQNMDRISSNPPRIYQEHEIPRRITSTQELMLTFIAEAQTYQNGKTPPIIYKNGSIELSELNGKGRGRGSRLPDKVLLELWVPETSQTFVGKRVGEDIQWSEQMRSTWEVIHRTASFSTISTRTPLDLYLYLDTMSRNHTRSYEHRTRIKYQGEPWGDSLIDMILEPLNEYQVRGKRLEILPQDGTRFPLVFNGLNGRWSLAKITAPLASGSRRPPDSSFNTRRDIPQIPEDNGDPRFRVARHPEDLQKGVARMLEARGNGISREIMWDFFPGVTPQQLLQIQTDLKYMAHGRRFLIHDAPRKTTYVFDARGPRLRMDREDWHPPTLPNPMEAEDVVDLLKKLKFLETSAPLSTHRLRVAVKGDWDPQNNGALLMRSLSQRPRFLFQEIELSYTQILPKGSYRVGAKQEFNRRPDGIWVGR